MADNATSTAHAVWHHLLALREDLLHNLENKPSDTAAEDRLIAVEAQLLDLEAPTLDGVRLKLGILWAARLDGDHPEARYRRQILSDLESLAPASDTPSNAGGDQ